MTVGVCVPLGRGFGFFQRWQWQGSSVELVADMFTEKGFTAAVAVGLFSWRDLLEKITMLVSPPTFKACIDLLSYFNIFHFIMNNLLLNIHGIAQRCYGQSAKQSNHLVLSEYWLWISSELACNEILLVKVIRSYQELFLSSIKWFQ